MDWRGVGGGLTTVGITMSNRVQSSPGGSSSDWCEGGRGRERGRRGREGEGYREEGEG